MTVAMRRPVDCGPIAMANHLEAVLGSNAENVYNQIMEQYGFPESDGITADFWDSPPRHFKVLEAITGQGVGIIDTPHPGPCVVLLMITPTAWHWVNVLPAGLWHDGHNLRSKTFQEVYPGCRVVMAYALGAVGPLPWYWSIWWAFTRLFVGGMP